MSNVPLRRKANTKILFEESNNEDEGDWTIIRFHATDIVKYNAQRIILNSNGWRTATTKRRMNLASAEHDLGFNVYQVNFIWYVLFNHLTYTFFDNMVLERT